MELSRGQVAVITGGASGIGLGLAEALVHRGLGVVIADLREDGLQAAAAGLREAGGDVLAVEVDVREPDAVGSLADATIERFGRVDLVCNNAGVVGETAPMWEQGLGTWRWLIDIKIMGVVHGVRAFAPLLIAQGTGHILNTASMGGLMPLPTMSPYNATMHAVVGMTETLDQELRAAAPSVGATVLCPGMVATGLVENSSWVRPEAARSPEVSAGGAMAAGPGVLSRGDVAQAALTAVEADRVHAVVSPVSMAGARQRAQAVLDALA